MATIQECIKERRSALGLTLAEIADMLNVKEATVQRYESGEIKNMKHETVVELAGIFKCSPQYLMGWSDNLVEPSSLSPTPEDEELLDYLEQLKTRPEIKKLFKLAINSSKEDIEKTIRVIEALKGQDE